MKAGDIVKNNKGKLGIILAIKNNIHVVEDICHEWTAPKILLVMLSNGIIENRVEYAYKAINNE